MGHDALRFMWIWTVPQLSLRHQQLPTMLKSSRDTKARISTWGFNVYAKNWGKRLVILTS
ncbi:hypothetical protein PLEOSDRAFT_1079999 [Pleurotus ostreatus PC15]|uniref:Uncharacterized protein n=1 Tax=Pleurotus ostreatus (strain PC15) TaxID=1137138 RepID=A0A067NGL1_PLEO1|nr:hypothetical protein PLEOSDRAFT_1079999 [Pleurotus ostreatus PC15]